MKINSDYIIENQLNMLQTFFPKLSKLEKQYIKTSMECVFSEGVIIGQLTKESPELKI